MNRMKRIKPRIGDGFSERIKTFRYENKVTQGELANLIGITVGTLSRWERGLGVPRSKVSIDRLVKMGIL